MTKLKVDTLKGLRLWLSVSDMETFALMANPGMNSEQILDLIQSMDSQDWLVLFKKFAMTFHQVQRNYPLEVKEWFDKNYSDQNTSKCSPLILQSSNNPLEDSPSLFDLDCSPDFDQLDSLNLID